ncbi:MAG: AAA family ATPase [Symploca sp. SIO1A3]|nr:AAA family ATPase [Symploca sp. SIO1A3]
MRIKQISVSGLFGIFNHVIPLNMDERITIIHSPNGFGKTVMLKMLDGFVNSRHSVFQDIPFDSFLVQFDNGSAIEITEKNSLENENDENNITGKFYNSSAEVVEFNFNVMDLHSEKKDSSIYLWKDAYSLMLKRYRDSFADSLPTKSTNLPNDKLEWLEELKSAIPVRLIESQRLLNFFPRGYVRLLDETPSRLPTVSAYSDELAELMQDKFTEYGTLSQSLDRTFPVRVVKQRPSLEITEKKLSSQLDELEKTRSRLIEVGLLDKDENTDFQLQPQAIDESTKNILSVYVEDVERKLSVFSEIANKIELLRRIINKKFAYSYKKINFSKEKGFVFTNCYNPSSVSEQKTLEPTDLSSGEQHELIMLYELLFKVEPKTLVLIDEPELSLHIGWQVEFIKDLQEITKLADLDILMATHSPDIIQNRWDLTVELKGLEN